MSDGAQLRITAFHEAGHVLLYLDRSVEFSHVTIVPDLAKGFLGCVHPAHENMVRPWDSAVTEAAGATAEILRLLLDADPDALTSHEDERHHFAADLATAVYMMAPEHREFLEAQRIGETCMLSLDATLDAVVRVLLRRWDHVDRLAGALLAADDGTLTYAQVLDLLDWPRP